MIRLKTSGSSKIARTGLGGLDCCQGTQVYMMGMYTSVQINGFHDYGKVA